MAASAQINSYLNNHYEGMEQEKLILLLYQGALKRLALTREGINENNIQKRGENLSKVIAIVAELNGSLNPAMDDEGTRFLRGLYSAILMELPKVSATNDLPILERTERYLSRLKEIWETDVMGKKIVTPDQPVKKTAPKLSSGSGYGGNKNSTTFRSISV